MGVSHRWWTAIEEEFFQYALKPIVTTCDTIISFEWQSKQHTRAGQSEWGDNDKNSAIEVNWIGSRRLMGKDAINLNAISECKPFLQRFQAPIVNARIKNSMG